MQDIEYCAVKIGKEEYNRSVWNEADLQPEGGCVFEPELEGARYMHHGKQRGP